PEAGQTISLSPTFYESPRELRTSFTLQRINPETKEAHLQWVAERARVATQLITGEFTGRTGKKERKPPTVREGTIACALVSGSPKYNESLRAIDRKILAVETESGGMFSVAQRRGVPAIAIRGISDYAGTGIDKNLFEEETNNQARKIATL